MSTPAEEYSYSIAIEDIDTSLLPSDARTPGSDAFRTEVSKLIQKDYEHFGGFTRIVVGDRNVEVSWRADPSSPDPMQVIIGKLERGEHLDAVRLLEHLRLQRPQSVEVLCNLGMALSDMGRLEEAEHRLRQAIQIAPNHVSALVALGVALTRQHRNEDAIGVLREAVAQDPENSWAQRNLGACLLQRGEIEEAGKCLRRAVEINPGDPHSVLGLAEAIHAAGHLREADDWYAKVIDLDHRSQPASIARNARRKLAEVSFRRTNAGGLRMDAVMYLLGAIRKFDEMHREEVQKIGFEIAILGQQGLDPHDSAQKYTLKSLPGNFSGLNLICLMYVAFQIVAPEQDLGFDLSGEYEAAQQMHADEESSR